MCMFCRSLFVLLYFWPLCWFSLSICINVNISEVLSLLQRYKQKIIVHNGNNYTNKFYNMIYLDVYNKVNIKKNKVK